MSRSLLIVLITLALASLACNLPFAAPVGGAPPGPAATEAPVVVGPVATEMPALPTLPTTPTAFPIPARGGFTTGDLDPALLPRISYMVAGMGPISCTESISSPTITLTKVVGDLYQLCLYGFSTEPGGSPVTVTINAPDGRSSTETFTVELDTASGSKVVRGQRTGSQTYLFEEPGFPAPFMVLLEVTAFFPAGDYGMVAQTADGTVSASGTATVSAEPLTSILRVGQIPDLFTSSSLYDPADPITGVVFYGRGYAPNSSVILALLDQSTLDPVASTIQVSHATQVNTSPQGEFTTIFYVGSEQIPGLYNVSAAPTMGELIHEPFGESFNTGP